MSFSLFGLSFVNILMRGPLFLKQAAAAKLRWAAKGKGKRGGARVIYFLRVAEVQIVLVAAYGKGERDDVPRAGSNESRRYLVVSKTKEALGRFIETIDKGGKVERARKTRFIPQADGSMRRLVTRKDGTIEKDEIIPPDRTLVSEARAKTGLSQDKFAALLGISVRTLRDWEQGRRSPSGAARTLLRIAAKHPKVLREVA